MTLSDSGRKLVCDAPACPRMIEAKSMLEVWHSVKEQGWQSVQDRADPKVWRHYCADHRRNESE